MQHLLNSNTSKRTPMTNPQSHSFSQRFGTILPTSLSYLTLLTKGCSPLRPDAVIGTNYAANELVSRIFKHRRMQSESLAIQETPPFKVPFLRARCFQGRLMFKRKENASQSIHKDCPSHNLLPNHMQAMVAECWHPFLSRAAVYRITKIFLVV